jgi:hypothetical protein
VSKIEHDGNTQSRDLTKEDSDSESLRQVYGHRYLVAPGTLTETDGHESSNLIPVYI